jgi:hypothetical protein
LVIGFVEHLQIVTTSNYRANANSHTPQFTTARTKSSQSAVSSPVDVPLLPDSRPLRLVAISYQPPTFLTAVSRLSYKSKSKSQSKLGYDRRFVGQCVLVSSTHLGLTISFWLLSDSCGFVHVGRFLWREDGSAAYNCCLSSPAQSSLGPSPAGLMAIFYCLGFETPPTWRARSPYLYPPRTGWPSYTPRHWVSLSSPPTTRRAMVEVFEPASTWGNNGS